MNNTYVLNERLQTRGEELANSITHGLALVAVVIASPWLILESLKSADTGAIAGSCIFAATMVVVYTTSTLYHSMPFGKSKHILRVIDHGAIFLLIAGTYTPFTLGVLEGGWGMVLLILEWLLAITGISLKFFTGVKYRKLSIFLYLAMGWLVLVAIEPFINNIPYNGIFWILAGGVAYTAGIPFYAAKNIRYTHLVWHLFVITGSFCHFVAVMWYSV